MGCCLIAKTSGTAKFEGYEVGSEERALKIRKIIGLVPDNVGLIEPYTAYENLDYHGTLYRWSDSERKESNEYFLKLLGLWEKKDVLVRNFSKGTKQKLAIARALIHDPEIVLMINRLQTLIQKLKSVREFILELKRKNKTIFLTTHNLNEAQIFCDKFGILNTKLIAIGAPEQLDELSMEEKQ